ncbi:MAG: PIN domain-containing protein [Leptospiraceae bacterium]|nr:PIN domain-containing protein [Leptospiraceae bacterium]
MKGVFFDTTVLVSAMVTSHPAHHRTFPYFEKVFQEKEMGFISTHCIAELYAVLTVLPIKPKLFPLEVEKILQKNIYSKFEIISLSPKDYKNAVSRVSELHLSGGIFYDSLHIEAAIKSNAEKLITINHKHFEKISDKKIKILGI